MKRPSLDLYAGLLCILIVSGTVGAAIAYLLSLNDPIAFFVGLYLAAVVPLFVLLLADRMGLARERESSGAGHAIVVTTSGARDRSNGMTEASNNPLSYTWPPPVDASNRVPLRLVSSNEEK